MTDIEWIRLSVGAFGFLLPCEVRVFPNREAAAARGWIVADLPDGRSA